MNRLKEIDVIRAFVVVVLVVYHAFAPFASGWVMPSGLTNNIIYYWFAKLCYSGMLETFVFISGYVFAYSAAKRDISFSKLISSKFKRLLIPSICWGIIMNMIFFSDAKWFTFNFWIEIINGYAHFWFLPMLFWVFIFNFLVKKYESKIKYLNGIIVILAILPYPTLPMGINNAFYYLAFFHFGCLCFYGRQKLQNIPNIKIGFIVLLYIVLFVISTELINSSLLDLNAASSLLHKACLICCGTILKFIYSIIMVFAYYLIFSKLSIKISESFYEKINFVARYSFGVYILHQIIIMLLYYKTSLSLILGLFSPWIIFIITFATSIVFSTLLSKGKLTKYII